MSSEITAVDAQRTPVERMSSGLISPLAYAPRVKNSNQTSPSVSHVSLKGAIFALANRQGVTVATRPSQDDPIALMPRHQNNTHTEAKTSHPFFPSFDTDQTIRDKPRTALAAPLPRRSSAIAIKKRRVLFSGEDASLREEEQLQESTEQYNLATWNMYYRIMNHRSRHPVRAGPGPAVVRPKAQSIMAATRLL